MKRYFTILAILLVAFAQVPVLDTSTFTRFIEQHQLVFVKFYAPWCGHCKALAPQFDKLQALTQGKSYSVAKVDCTVTEGICQQYNVNGYPTLLLLVKGSPVPYQGSRNAPAIAEWIEKIVQKQIDIITALQVEQKKNTESFVVVSGLSKQQLFVFKAISIIRDEVNFYFLQAEVKGIRLYLKGKEPIDFPQKQINQQQVSNWIFHQARPAILPLSVESNFEYVKDQDDFNRILVLLSFQDDILTSLQPSLESYCNDDSKILCVSVKSTDKNFLMIKGMFNFKDKITSLFLITSDFKIAYRFQIQESSPSAIASFVNQASIGKLERTFDADKEKRLKFNYANVIKLTDENYNATLRDNKFVFVQYYSPDCKHCVNFVADYDKIGAHFKDEGVIIAAVDVTEHRNIADQEDISSYPSLRFFLKGNSIPYRDDRSVQRVVNFITEIVNSKATVVASKDDIIKPAVVVSGISATSDLQFISGLFSLYPVYVIQGQTQFSIQIHEESGVSVYEGRQSLAEVVDWLQEETAPILLNLGEANPSPRLKNVVDSQIPILSLLIKGIKSPQKALTFLLSFCQGQTKFACGFVSKGSEDYQSWLNWIGDTDPTINRLVLVSLEPLKKFVYQGDVDDLGTFGVSAWLYSIQNGQVPEYEPKASIKSGAQQEQVVDSGLHNVQEL